VSPVGIESPTNFQNWVNALTLKSPGRPIVWIRKYRKLHRRSYEVRT